MDAAVDSAIRADEIGGIVPFRKWNRYTQEVDEPIFLINYGLGVDDAHAKKAKSFISSDLQIALNLTFLDILDSDNSPQVVDELLTSIDPFLSVLKKKSTFRYTREYYDLATLDSQLALFSENKTVLMFSPRYIQYCKEKKCNVILILAEGQGEHDKSLNDKDEEYFDGLNVINGNSFQVDIVDRPSFSNDDDSLSLEDDINRGVSLGKRWRWFEKLATDEQLLRRNKVKPGVKLPADVIINMQETYGRYGIHITPGELVYDKIFFEAAVRGLNSLKDGGTYILLAGVIGNKLIVDLCYLYKYLFRELCIVKPASSNPVGHAHYIVALAFDKKKYLQLKPKLDVMLGKLLAFDLEETMREANAENNEADNEDIDPFNLYSFITNTELGAVNLARPQAVIPKPLTLLPIGSVPATRVTSTPGLLSQVTGIGFGLGHPTSFENTNVAWNVASNLAPNLTTPKQAAFVEPETEGTIAEEIKIVEDDFYSGTNSAHARNFVEWAMEMNNEIALSIYTNASRLLDAVKNRRLGFSATNPYFTFDHVSYRQSIGFLGRTTLRSLPQMKTSQEIVGPTQQTTSTEQVAKSIISLDKKYVLSWKNFLFHYEISFIVDAISKISLPLVGSTKPGNQYVTSAVLFKDRRDRVFFIREWMGLLYALGDLDRIMATIISKEEIETMLKERRWTIRDIYGNLGNQILQQIQTAQTAQQTQDNPQSTVTEEQLLVIIYSTVAQILFDAATFYRTTLVPNENASLGWFVKQIGVKFTVTSLLNLRFRIAYTIEGKHAAIMHRNNPSVIGEYEIMNLLTPDELLQIMDTQQLAQLTLNDEFVARMVNHICLPVLFAGNMTEMAIPEFYFKYKPDIEAFASATNRYAPIWCSANDEDTKLGSKGNFFGAFSTIGSPIFNEIFFSGPILDSREPSYLSMIAFPPMNEEILKMTIDRCCDIIVYLKQQLNNSSADNPIVDRTPVSLTIIVVYNNTGTNKDIIFTSLLEHDLDFNENSIEYITEAYDPFSGTVIPCDLQSFRFD